MSDVVFTTWAQWLADDAIREDYRRRVEHLAEALDVRLPAVATDVPLTGPALAACAALEGPETLRALLPARTTATIAAWLGAFDTVPRSSQGLAVFRTLLFAGTARGAGLELPWPNRTRERLPELVEAVADTERTWPALAMLAIEVGAPSVVEALYGPPAEPFAPGRRFGFNLQGFVHYLVRAVDAGADAADVEPAWSEFLRAFPRKLAAGTVEWTTLPAAARVFTVCLERRPESETVGRLHARVVALAAEGA